MMARARPRVCAVLDSKTERNPRICAERHRHDACARLRSTQRLTTVLIVVALVVLAMAIAVGFHKRRAEGRPDLGWVTERWLAEYRADASRPSR